MRHCMQALDAFLGARRAYVTGALQGAAAAGQLPLEELSGKLADAVAQMQASPSWHNRADAMLARAGLTTPDAKPLHRDKPCLWVYRLR